MFHSEMGNAPNALKKSKMFCFVFWAPYCHLFAGICATVQILIHVCPHHDRHLSAPCVSWRKVLHPPPSYSASTNLSYSVIYTPKPSGTLYSAYVRPFCSYRWHVIRICSVRHSLAASRRDANVTGKVLPWVRRLASWLLLLPARLRKRMMPMSLKYFPECGRLLPGCCCCLAGRENA